MGYSCIANTSQKAKKEHRCTWCGQQIPVGEIYVRIRGVFEGEPQTDKLHPECDAAAEAYFREWGGDEGYSPFEQERPPKLPISDASAEQSK